MLEKVKRGEMTRAEQRAVAANAIEASVDAQGRITIDRELRDFAGLELGSPVIVSGSFDRAEIWNTAVFEAQTIVGSARRKATGVNGKEDPRRDS